MLPSKWGRRDGAPSVSTPTQCHSGFGFILWASTKNHRPIFLPIDPAASIRKRLTQLIWYDLISLSIFLFFTSETIFEELFGRSVYLIVLHQICIIQRHICKSMSAVFTVELTVIPHESTSTTTLFSTNLNGPMCPQMNASASLLCML